MTTFVQVTPETTIAGPVSPVRIVPMVHAATGGKKAPAGWSVAGANTVYVFQADVPRATVATWLKRHGYRLGAKGEWRRA